MATKTTIRKPQQNKAPQINPAFWTMPAERRQLLIDMMRQLMHIAVEAFEKTVSELEHEHQAKQQTAPRRKGGK